MVGAMTAGSVQRVAYCRATAIDCHHPHHLKHARSGLRAEHAPAPPLCRGNRLEKAFKDYVLAAPRVEKYVHHRMYTDTAHGGLGLQSASWAGMRALIHLVQKALRLPGHKMPSQT